LFIGLADGFGMFLLGGTANRLPCFFRAGKQLGQNNAEHGMFRKFLN
jgi:hypothetical protein